MRPFAFSALFSARPARATHSQVLCALLVIPVLLTGCGGKKEATTTPDTSSNSTSPKATATSTPATSPTATGTPDATTTSKTEPTTNPTATSPTTPPVTATSPTTKPAAPPTNATAEVAAAKSVFKRADAAHNFTQFSECFSNDSAALISINSFGQVLRASLKPDPKNPQQADPASVANAKAQQAAYVKKHDLDKLQKGTDADLVALGKNGRAMLADVDNVVNTLIKQGRLKSNPLAQKLTKPRFGSESDFNFTAVDANTVKISPKKSAASTAEIRLEDGQWRLHLGDLVTARKQSIAMQKQQQQMQQQQMQQQGGGGMAPGGSPLGGGSAPPMPGGSTPPPTSPLGGGTGTPPPPTSPLGGGSLPK